MAISSRGWVICVPDFVGKVFFRGLKKHLTDRLDKAVRFINKPSSRDLAEDELSFAMYAVKESGEWRLYYESWDPDGPTRPGEGFTVNELEQHLLSSNGKDSPKSVKVTKENSGSKYVKTIEDVNGKEAILVDVYCVLHAFNVVCPARAHAIKKILMAGKRGEKSAEQDLREAIDAITRAITLLA